MTKFIEAPLISITLLPHNHREPSPLNRQKRQVVFDRVQDCFPFDIASIAMAACFRQNRVGESLSVSSRYFKYLAAMSSLSDVRIALAILKRGEKGAG